MHSLPYEKSGVIPPHEQDHDFGRFDPNDGQAVVDLLNQSPGHASPDDIGTSDAPASAPSSSHLPEGVFYGDLRQRKEPASEKNRYDRGLDTTKSDSIDWRRWNLQSPGYFFFFC